MVVDLHPFNPISLFLIAFLRSNTPAGCKSSTQQKVKTELKGFIMIRIQYRSSFVSYDNHTRANSPRGERPCLLPTDLHSTSATHTP